MKLRLLVMTITQRPGISLRQKILEENALSVNAFVKESMDEQMCLSNPKQKQPMNWKIHLELNFVNLSHAKQPPKQRCH